VLEPVTDCVDDIDELADDVSVDECVVTSQPKNPPSRYFSFIISLKLEANESHAPAVVPSASATTRT
jgi:hypothetical protein